MVVAENATTKELNEDNFAKSELEHRLEQTSVQVEPKYKFSLGQKVILHFYGGEIGTISERLPPQDGIVWNCYKVKGLPHHIWRENELDPYDNPILTYHVGQRVRVIKVTNLAILHKIGTIEEVPVDAQHDMYKVRFANGYAHLEASKLEPFTEPTPKFNAGDKVKIVDKAIVTFGNTATIQGYAGKESENMYWVDDKIGLYSESQIESYIEENKEPIVSKDDTMDDTKEPMEEKELNLCELLKGCEGEEFWSPMFDAVKLSRIDIGDNKPLMFNWKDGVIYTRPNGVMYSNTLPIIFPSRALYEKYPLDARAAWMEWQSERKPKRWKPSLGDEYFSISGCAKVIKLKHLDNSVDLELERIHNRFRTEEEAKQAAEAVREALMKFHEKNAEK